jgi:hypothetical protein
MGTVGTGEAEDRFAAVCDQLADRPGVARPDPARRGFGASALTVNGSIFAMLVAGGSMVVKLPRARVEELIATGAGAPFHAGKDRPMKEWLTVTGDDPATWRELAEQALEFVGSQPPRRRSRPPR